MIKRYDVARCEREGAAIKFYFEGEPTLTNGDKVIMMPYDAFLTLMKEENVEIVSEVDMRTDESEDFPQILNVDGTQYFLKGRFYIMKGKEVTIRYVTLDRDWEEEGSKITEEKEED